MSDFLIAAVIFAVGFAIGRLTKNKQFIQDALTSTQVDLRVFEEKMWAHVEDLHEKVNHMIKAREVEPLLKRGPGRPKGTVKPIIKPGQVFVRKTPLEPKTPEEQHGGDILP